MKDVTSTSFGLLIGFLLPGLAGLYCTTFWSPHMKIVFQKFLSADANVGLFFLVILGSLICGLQISVLRWILFEEFLCRKHKFAPGLFKNLKTDDKLEAFRAAVDEHYRYHQFWGGMAIIIPFAYFGIRKTMIFWFPDLSLCWLSFGAVIVEITTICAAWKAFKNYTQRATHILTG